MHRCGDPLSGYMRTKSGSAKREEWQCEERGGVMRRLSFLLGLAVGFVLGSKSGSAPYEQLVCKVRSIAHQPEVHDTIEEAKAAATTHATEAVAKVHEAIEGVDGRSAASVLSD